MNYVMIPEAICGIKDETFLLLKYLRAAEMTDIAAHPDVYSEFITEASMRAEKIACEIRRLVYRSTDKRKAEHLSQIARTPHGIVIESTDKCMKITLPALIPKKKNTNAEFLSEPLFCALSEHIIEHGFEKLNDAVICFEHIYDRKLPKKLYRDYDNLEQKQILDTVALYTLLDDNSSLCNVFNTSCSGDESKTCIYVMPKEAFSEWLNRQK